MNIKSIDSTRNRATYSKESKIIYTPNNYILVYLSTYNDVFILLSLKL